MMKKIAILGSTGSIGRNTLNVIKNLNNNGYDLQVVFLSSFSNYELLLHQIKEFNVASACIIEDINFLDVKQKCKTQGCNLLQGYDALIESINPSISPPKIEILLL